VQVLWLHTTFFPRILRLLRMADRGIYSEYHAVGGHVPLLYLPPSNTRRAPPRLYAAAYRPTFSVGRYPDHLLAQSSSTYRSHPALESTHRALLILFPSARERGRETRRSRHRQPYHAARKLSHCIV
jgi:hypothetical protein